MSEEEKKGSFTTFALWAVLLLGASLLIKESCETRAFEASLPAAMYCDLHKGEILGRGQCTCLSSGSKEVVDKAYEYQRKRWEENRKRQ